MVSRSTRYVISVVLSVLCSQAVSSAADYYVSTTGNDGNTGRSSTAPWRTLDKVNAVSFAPGDRVFFARGGIWRGVLKPASSGVARSPITFGAYGSGAAPILAGSDNLSGSSWRRSASGTNTYYCYASGLVLPDAVWLNGAHCTRGTAGSLADHQWDWSDRDSLGFSTIYIRDDSGAPATTGALIESAVRSYAVYGSGKSYLTFENFEARHTDNYGSGFGLMHFNACKNITIRGCRVHDITAYGIRFIGSGSANHVVQGNTIYNALPVWNYPCLVRLDQTAASTIAGNTIHTARDSTATNAAAVGITIQGSSSGITIERNEIYDCDGDHIYVRDYSSNCVIRYNYLHDGRLGIFLREAASNNRIYGNLIVEVDNPMGLNATGGSTSNNLFYNNTCYNQAHANYRGVVFIGSHPGARFFNNTVWTNGVYTFSADAAAAATITTDRNCFYKTTSSYMISWAGVNYPMSSFASYQSASGQDLNSIARDPLFTSAGSQNFSLQSTSPCINRGVDLGDAYRYALAAGSTWPSAVQMLDQRSYGAWEIGAYVYGTAPTTSYSLTTSASNGTITRTPNQSSYVSGTTVTLQATPNSGYMFTGWSGDLTGTTNPATLVMNSNKSVTANFAPIPVTTYTLTISATNGTVTKTPNQTSYASGTTVTLQATPNSGYVFTGWSGDLTGTTNPATLVMNSNKSVTANFAPIPVTTYTLTISATNGTVTKTPNQTSYASGTTVTLQATPNSGYVFTGWSGALTGTTNPATLVMNSNKSVTANFAPASVTTYRLTIRCKNGSVTRTPNQPRYASGTTVTLRATPKSGYVFSRWSGDLSGSQNPTTIVMNSDKYVLAYFVRSSTTYSLITSAADGTVAKTPEKTSYYSGEAVMLEAMPRSGYTFTGWSGALTGTLNPARVVVDTNKSVTANFTPTDATASAVNTNEVQDSPVMAETVEPMEVMDAATVKMPAAEADAGETAATPGMPGFPSINDDQGNTWTMWQAGDDGQQQIFISRASHGIETLADIKQLSGGDGDHCSPVIAQDTAGVLYAIWQENVRGNWDVRVSVSADGSTWSAPKLIVDSEANQTSPAISVGTQPEDPVTVVWQDDRTGNPNAYMATSIDAFISSTVAEVTSDQADQTDPAVPIDGEDALFPHRMDTKDGSIAEVESSTEP